MANEYRLMILFESENDKTAEVAAAYMLSSARQNTVAKIKHSSLEEVIPARMRMLSAPARENVDQIIISYKDEL